MSKHKWDGMGFEPFYHGDPDFPDPSNLTPEERENILAAWEAATPKLNTDKPVKHVWVFGTGGEIDNTFREIRRNWEDE